MAKTKLKQYVAEYFIVEEVKNGTAPTRTTRVSAKNTRDAHAYLATADMPIVVLSLKLDKGQGKPGRKPKHKLTKKELAQVELILNPPVKKGIKTVSMQEQGAVASDWDEAKAFKDSDKFALASLDALANDEPIQGTKKSDKAAEVINSIGCELEEKGSCPACGDDNWDENDNCVTCYAIGIDGTAEKLVGDVDDTVQPTPILKPVDVLVESTLGTFEEEAEGEDANLCPTCNIGTDDDGDDDCAVCTSPAYLQAIAKQPLTDAEVIPEAIGYYSYEFPVDPVPVGAEEPKPELDNPSVTTQALLLIAFLVIVLGIVMYATR